MKQLEKDLTAIAKDLKKLTQRTEKMVNWLKKLEKAQAAKKAKPKAVRKAVTKRAVTRKAVTRKPTKTPARDTVLAIIKSSKKGVDTPALKNKTGFQGRKIGDIIYRLKKQGKIKTEGKGLYVKA